MLHFLRRSTLFITLLVLGVAWIGCTTREGAGQHTGCQPPRCY